MAKLVKYWSILAAPCHRGVSQRSHPLVHTSLTPPCQQLLIARNHCGVKDGKQPSLKHDPRSQVIREQQGAHALGEAVVIKSVLNPKSLPLQVQLYW